MPNHLTSVFYGLRNETEFHRGVQHVLNNINGIGVYTGDNLLTFGKNLGFLEDERFMRAFSGAASPIDEQQRLWRLHVLCWAASNGLRLKGDFVECACYRGTSARIVAEYTKLRQSGKRYFLYDLFEHAPGMAHHAMPLHSDTLFEHVRTRFADMPNVVVTRGRVPEILRKVAPASISFMHLDLNNAEAEIGALMLLFERMVPGAILVLDDYGWAAYRDQKVVEDAFFEKRGYRVLELPTGQGLVVK